MRRSVSVIIIVVGLFIEKPMLWGQEVGSCDPSTASAVLDANDVLAKIYNHGGLFYNQDDYYGYLVPRNDSTIAIFDAALWIGGKVDGELRMSFNLQGLNEFWAGPLDDNGKPPSDCTPYDRIFKISAEDLSRYNSDPSTATQDLLDWPYSWGAPVVDGDGNPDNYNLEGGDRPELFGDQMTWWIMNDAGNSRNIPSENALGIEVRAKAFAMNHDSALNTTTFYQYIVENKSGKDIEETYFGLWSDVDLGTPGDDALGSDSLLSLVYTYNQLDVDDGGGGYGARPPALGFDFLQGPVADLDHLDNDRDGEVDEAGETILLSNFVSVFKNIPVQGEPISIRDAYSYMRSQWRDRGSVTEGGYGRHVTNTPSKIMFPAEIGDYWSWENSDGNGTALSPYDVRFAASAGPFTFEAGSTDTLTFAIIWARGEDRLASVEKLKEASKYVQIAFDNDVYKCQSSQARQTDIVVENSLPDRFGIARPFPNPSTGILNFGFHLPENAETQMTVFDLQGRLVRGGSAEIRSPGVHDEMIDLSEQSPGVYFLHLRIGDAIEVLPIHLID